MKSAGDYKEVSMVTDAGFITIAVPVTLRDYKRRSIRYYIDSKKGYYTGKRIFDVLVSSVFIAGVLSWLIPVLAILIKLTSKGPVFFKQKRVGRGGKSFTCYKLRTMILNNKADVQEAVENDERVTSIGKFLRTSNLDEFPQFFNVFMGSMSIVGPRPHMHADCSKYSSLVKEYKFRNLVKPGITGLSQIKGLHGRVISNECILNRFQWDVFYVRNAGFLLDLQIIFTTAIQRIRFFIRL